MDKMNLNVEARVPKLESLTYNCLDELKTISKTLIEMNRLKRLKLKPKQHVFPLSIQGANREAIKMYDEIQELKLKKEQERCSCTQPHTPGEFPACLVPSYTPDVKPTPKLVTMTPERGPTEFPAELVPKDPFDEEYTKMTLEERRKYVLPCTQCTAESKPKLVVMTPEEEAIDIIQSCVDACNPTTG